MPTRPGILNLGFRWSLYLMLQAHPALGCAQRQS